MANPTYTTDLLEINLAENSGTWDEMDDWAGGGTVYTNEEDFLIQGSYCTSQLCTKAATSALTSLVVDYGSDLAGSFTPGETCAFMWQVFLPANAVGTYAQGGLRFIVGADLADFNAWIVGGNDTGRNPYGGWQNVVVDPSFTPDYQDDGAVGNGGVYQVFGSGLYLLRGIGKGAPHGVDAIRYGRGDYKVELGETLTPATFIDMAVANDAQLARWGLFQEQAGTYLWKGLISLGTAANAVEFIDSNKNITVDITNRTFASFNKIEINHLDSIIDWTGISITSLDGAGLSPGQLEVIDDATVGIDTCTFTDMSTLIFKSNSTIDNTTFRRCGNVTQGGAVFESCVFEESTATTSLSVDDLDNIDNCDFTSDGSNHGIELDSSHAGGEFTIEGCTFTDYAAVSGSTGNECIYNNAGSGLVTIYIVGGDYPTIRNGINATTKLIQATTYTLTGLVSGSEVNFVRQDNGDTLYHIEIATEDDGSGRDTKKVIYSYNYSADIPVYIYIHKVEYVWMNVEDTLTDTNKITPVAQQLDRWYSNP